MKKWVTVTLFVLFAVFAFAGQFNSVPLGHKSYDIIASAELRGIIPVQSDIKPYDYKTVVDLLNNIISSSEITETERSSAKLVLSSLNDSGLVNKKVGDSKINIGTTVHMEEKTGLNTDNVRIADLRNKATVYLDIDFLKNFSANMNATLLIDRLSTGAYLPGEFLYECDGDYTVSFCCGNTSEKLRAATIDDPRLFVGLTSRPEVNASLYDGAVKIKFADYNREWGPAAGNLMLSKYASPFYGFEIDIKPVDWLSLSAMTGSLANSVIERVDGASIPGHETCEGERVVYNNNFSTQRVELNITDNFRFSLYESVIWKQRFELAYLNPVSIYWLTQTLTGDHDNILGGLDLSWNLPHIGKLYASFCLDEFTADLKHFFTAARNILAMQFGFEMPVNFGNFTTVTFQGTYIPPFFGTHYYYGASDVSESLYSTSYTNRGFSLGYPVTPDTAELMVAVKTGFADNWSVDVVMKDQIYSAQYALQSYESKADIGKAGNNYLTAMNYWQSKNYENRAFLKNAWRNIFDLDVSVTRSYSDHFPEFTLGFIARVDKTKFYTVTGLQPAHPDFEWQGYINNGTANMGRVTMADTWNKATVTILGKVGLTIKY